MADTAGVSPSQLTLGRDETVTFSSTNELDDESSGSVSMALEQSDHVHSTPPFSDFDLPQPGLCLGLWGDLDSTSYSEIVHWRRNLFQVPLGASGRAFVYELSRLFYAGSALESVALKSVFVCCVLLLQRPHRISKTQD